MNTILHHSLLSSPFLLSIPADTNVSCLAPWVINLSVREDIFIVSQDAQPRIPNPNLSEWRRVRHTDWCDTLLYACRPISLPPILLLLFLISLLTWPLVYRHHQLNTTSLNICPTNDCGVKKSINLSAPWGGCWGVQVLKLNSEVVIKKHAR